MRANDILSDQVVVIKRGRSNGLGFEPAFNSYFDFYLNSKYFAQPLLELGDVTFHLFLRKNLNDTNKNWKMPTVRQMMKRFGISQGKIYAMLDRLEKAHLLTKESGIRVGTVNTRNDYILSDPIPTLDEFLEVAAEGLFGLELLPEYRPPATEPPETPLESPCIENQYMPEAPLEGPCIENQYMDVLKIDTCHVLKINTDQQTLKTKQTSGEVRLDPVFEELRFSMGAKIFDRFMNKANLIDIEGDTAVIGTPFAYAKDFIEHRLADKIKRAFKVDAVRCVVLTE